MEKIVYLTGKVNGDPFYRGKFVKAERIWKDLGYSVMSPAYLPQGIPEENYLAICLRMIDACDTICLLPDWLESESAIYELGYAATKNKIVVMHEVVLRAAREEKANE